MLLSLVFAIAASSNSQIVGLTCIGRPAEAKAPATPKMPDGKMFPGQKVTLVKVHLSATGSVLGTSIAKSSGDKDLDRAAIVAANASEFTPESKNCKSVASYYVFRVEFVAE